MDAAERKARAVGILVAAFKRLLWETAVAQEQAGSAKHCWVLPQSCLANSTLLCFAWILHTFPGAGAVPGPTAWLGVESSGVTLVQIKLYTTVTAPARALSISCRKPLIANPRGLAASLCHKMQLAWPSWGGLCHKMWPHARSHRARRVPLMAGELITPLEQQQWHTWSFKYDCLGLISVFFLFLSKGEAKIKSLYPISQALIKWSTWAHALR